MYLALTLVSSRSSYLCRTTSSTSGGYKTCTQMTTYSNSVYLVLRMVLILAKLLHNWHIVSVHFNTFPCSCIGTWNCVMRNISITIISIVIYGCTNHHRFGLGCFVDRFSQVRLKLYSFIDYEYMKLLMSLEVGHFQFLQHVSTIPFMPSLKSQDWKMVRNFITSIFVRYCIVQCVHFLHIGFSITLGDWWYRGTDWSFFVVNYSLSTCH